MKHRPKPFQVEHKKAKSTSAAHAARGAPPDSRIRAWSADAPKPEKPPLTEAEEALVAKFYYRQRLYKANNPEVLDEFCEKLAALDAVTDKVAAIIPVENHDTWGPGHFFASKDKASFRKLSGLYRKLYPKITQVQPPRPGDIRSPSSLRPFVRRMRRGEE
jgi:hypothetical protein